MNDINALIVERKISELTKEVADLHTHVHRAWGRQDVILAVLAELVSHHPDGDAFVGRVLERLDALPLISGAFASILDVETAPRTIDQLGRRVAVVQVFGADSTVAD